MTTLELKPSDFEKFQRHFDTLKNATTEELLDLAFPPVRARTDGLAGAKSWDSFKDWVKTNLNALFHQSWDHGKEAFDALRDPECGHKVYLASIVAAFLLYKTPYSDLPIKELTAIVLLAAVCTRGE